MRIPRPRWEDTTDEPEKGNIVSRAIKGVIGFVFHWFMIALSLSLIFVICGGFFFFRMSHSSSKRALRETPTSAIVVFCLGGAGGVGLFLYFYHRRKPQDFL